MKQGMIKLSKEFVTDFGLKEWVGFEYPIDYDTEDPSETMKMVRQMTIDAWQKSQSGTTITDAPGPSRPLYEIALDRNLSKEQEDRRIEVLIKDIEGETVLRNADGVGGLLAWKIIASTNPKLQAAFDLRKAQLELGANLKDMEGKWPHDLTKKQ